MSDAQNSERTAARPRGRPFAPGVSGNPGGRRPNLASLVRQRTREGRVLVDALVAIVRGDGDAPTRDRISAARTLLDFGFARPAPCVEDVASGDALSLKAVYVAEWADGGPA